MSGDNTALGATPADWAHWDLVLGLGADLLPVVADPSAPPSPHSKVKAFGKIPSRYTHEGAVGIAGWTNIVVTPGNVERWSRDSRLSMCVRTSAVRAIDVDVDDEELATNIFETLRHAQPEAQEFAVRTRANSHKFLVPFMLDAPLKKRIINTAHGRIELLADGQQFVVAGTHPSGVRYQWSGGNPSELPVLTLAQVDKLWELLDNTFGTLDSSAQVPTERNTQAPGVLSTTADEATLADLRDALAYKPLLAAAADNSVWSEIGYALLSLGTVGSTLWMRFSRAAPNHTPDAPESWWQAHEHQQPRSDYRHIFTLARKLGWRATVEADAFVDVTEPIGEAPPPEREPLHADVPLAKALCTDLRNAHRLLEAYGDTKLVVVGGTFIAWDYKSWGRDEPAAFRCAAHLSTMVMLEAKAYREKFKALIAATSADVRDAQSKLATLARPDQSVALATVQADKTGAAALKALEAAEALEKWAKHCEMQPTVAKAVTMLRNLLETKGIKLDAHTHLLTCLNGTIDLRTGTIKPHDPLDYISRCAPVSYRPDAKCPTFEQFMLDVMGGDAERVAFLQRWFGYAITGEVREQKILLHIGGGSNGKSTLIDVIQKVLGEYAHTGAPNLLTTSHNDRHPTEIADLAGRRLVTVHESEEGATLREGLLKQATGGDKLVGRFMYKDFFEFTPTHKLQLLTNAKPVVRGQDFAIWRRLLLINYGVTFGSAEDVVAHKATRLGDRAMAVKLEAEKEGIFAWLVRGAAEWYATGLRPPQSVIEASEAYRQEQDRIAEFVAERCIRGAEERSYLSGPQGIYPQYMIWSKSNGYPPMGNRRFLHELERVVPGYRVVDQKVVQDGVRKSQRCCYGLRVNFDEDGGGSVINSNEDLL